jgi:chemotaxis signal transduction protein
MNPAGLRGAPILAPITLLQVRALGAWLAFERTTVAGVFEMTEGHAAFRHGAGLVMLYGDEVLPLADYRSHGRKGSALVGADVVIALVRQRKFALLVDRLAGRLKVDYAEIRIPDRALVDRCPYLTGKVSRAEGDIYLIDLERLLGPAIRTHLEHRG